MFLMSNWALLTLIREGWFKSGKLILTSDPVPYAALVLFLLAVTLALETVYSIFVKDRKIAVN
jgi:hypothetical protein